MPWASQRPPSTPRCAVASSGMRWSSRRGAGRAADARHSRSAGRARLVAATHRLIEIVEARDLGVLFTHAYEGGHPDLTDFICRPRAARLLEAKGRAITVIEMPFYQAAMAT